MPFSERENRDPEKGAFRRLHFPAPDPPLPAEGGTSGRVHASATSGVCTEAACSGDVSPCFYKPRCSAGPPGCGTGYAQPSLQGRADARNCHGPEARSTRCGGDSRGPVPPTPPAVPFPRIPGRLGVCRNLGWGRVSNRQPPGVRGDPQTVRFDPPGVLLCLFLSFNDFIANI